MMWEETKVRECWKRYFRNLYRTDSDMSKSRIETNALNGSI